MSLQYIATDLAGTVIGEVAQADERKLSLPHMRVGTAAFKLSITDIYTQTLLDTDTLIKVYHTHPLTGARYLCFNGPVVAAEEVADGSSDAVVFTASDPMWRLTKRLIPGSLLRTSISYGTAGSLIDLGLIVHNILDDVNAANIPAGSPVGFTGISKGSRTASINGYYVSPPNKNAAEAIAELHVGVGSFEYKLTPTEPTNVAGNGGWPQIATLDIAPVIGSSRPDAVFEYGTTRANVASYSRQISRDGLMNRGIVSVSGWPDGTLEVQADRQDAASMTARGLFEDVVTEGGITDITLRNSLADFHLGIRKQPRQIITFKPTAGAAVTPLVDYFVGDSVRARAVVNGSLRFDATFRIWGINFDVDKNGNESVELELVVP
jgi:hypothetical protein